MNIIQRIKAESSDFGKWFTKTIPIIFVILAGCSETLEAVNVIPQDLIPIWVKQILAFGILFSKLLGHLTVKKEI